MLFYHRASISNTMIDSTTSHDNLSFPFFQIFCYLDRQNNHIYDVMVTLSYLLAARITLKTSFAVGIVP